MSTRKPTIDGPDDYDDPAGILKEERATNTDLSLHEADEGQVGLGHTPPGKDPYIEDKKREDER